MKRVIGIGGVFFQSRNPDVLRAWYRDHLGIDVQSWGGAVFSAGERPGTDTAWTVTSADDAHMFAPGRANFMINYRVHDLAALLQALRDEGCNVLPEVDESAHGRFGWVVDPEGNKVELWQAPEAP